MQPPPALNGGRAQGICYAVSMLRTARPFALALALGVATPVVLSLGEGSAQASTAIALTVQDLVDRSDAVVVAIPKSRTARWESGKIYTYTTVAIDTAVSGSGKAGETFVVRTLGGTVDKLGQQVAGEATLPLDAPLVLFLRPIPAGTTAPAGTRHVVGMAQGAFRVVTGKDKIARLEPHLDGLSLVPQPGVKDPAAHVALGGRAVADATTTLRAAWAKRVAK